MSKAKNWFLFLGVMITFVLTLTARFVEILRFDYYIFIYPIAFAVIFSFAVDSNIKISLRNLFLSWSSVFILLTGLVSYFSKGRGYGLLGSYFHLHFYLFVLVPMIVILVIGLLLKGGFSLSRFFNNC